MKIEQAMWLHEEHELLLEELCELSGLSETELRDLRAKLPRRQQPS